MRMMTRIPIVACLAATFGCGGASTDDSSLSSAEITVESPMPADRLSMLKAALPEVTFPKLKEIFASSQTVWYDHESMKPTYQAAILQSPPYGANSNDKWFNLIADSVAPTARNFYDEAKSRWRFPFGTTAGTDEVTNLKVFNFLYLPAKNGRLLPLAAYPAPQPINGRSFTMNSWGWKYPVGTVLGELLFVTTGPGGTGEIMPSEIRTRTRHETGWSVNAFRPFPTASSLSAEIKRVRPSWQSNARLAAMVSHLENDSTLVTRRLSAPQLPGTFEQEGAIDVLPDFGDVALVKELLTKTPFVSAYGAVWKEGGGKKTFAASTLSEPSIVPKNYEAGVIEVTDESCMRCHQDTGRHLTSFKPEYGPIVLYGELWGRDGIFSFHPFDESKYSVFWLQGTTDNRRLNPTLKSQGVIADYNAAVHSAPDYPREEVVAITEPEAEQAQMGGSCHPKSGGAEMSYADASEAIAMRAEDDDENVVEFRIPAGTGRGEWNVESTPVLAKPGQIVRIINDDATDHVLHTDERPCPHGSITRKVRQGEHYDCAIPAGTRVGTVYRLWDHFLGSPRSGRFWIKVQ